MTGYDRLLTRVDRGERPLHRPREWEAEARLRKKLHLISEKVASQGTIEVKLTKKRL